MLTMSFHGSPIPTTKELLILNGKRGIGVGLPRCYRVLIGLVTRTQIEHRSARAGACGSHGDTGGCDDILSDGHNGAVVVENLYTNTRGTTGYSQQVRVARRRIAIKAQGVITGFAFLQADAECFGATGSARLGEGAGWVLAQYDRFGLIGRNNRTGRLNDLTGETDGSVCSACSLKRAEHHQPGEWQHHFR